MTPSPRLDGARVRRHFSALQDAIYLNTATMSVGCDAAREAYRHAADRWAAGRFDWTEAEKAGEDARAMFAELVGARARDIALIPSVSGAAGLVAANLPDPAPGDNVVVAENEFSSNFFPWQMLRERQYEIRTVAGADGMRADAFAAHVDDRTRLMAVSAVHSPTGFKTDLPAFSEMARQAGSWLFVDACQAAGAVPLDVVTDRIDFLAASSHKFLLGARGMGYLYVRPELIDQMKPVGPGWKAGSVPHESFYGPSMHLSSTASKLDTSLVWFAALAEQASLGLFRHFGIAQVLERNASLSQRLHDALTERCPGFSAFPAAHRSSIVAVPLEDTDAVLARFRQANIVAAIRQGRVRLSVHFYNLESEIDLVASLCDPRRTSQLLPPRE